MWTRTYSKRIKGLAADKVWAVWSDINRWTEWQDDLESAKLEGEFKVGNTFTIRPKGGPNVKIAIHRAEKNVNFTDITKFPLAKMTGSHDLIQHGDELELRTTMTVTGLLTFLWVKIVAQGVADKLESQTDALVRQVQGA
jgi:hypothetical protein